MVGTGPVPVARVAQLLATGEAFATAVLTGVDAHGRDQVTHVAHLGRRPVTQPEHLIDALAGPKAREVTTARRSRRPDAFQQTALDWTSPTCSVEGCDLPRHEIDHRIDWSRTHHTRLDELDGYCTFHHALKTRQNYQLVEGSGRRAMVAPTDPDPP